MEDANLVLVVGTYSVTGAAADDFKALFVSEEQWRASIGMWAGR